MFSTENNLNPGEFDLAEFIQGRDSIAGARPAIDPTANVVRIEPLGIKERPYLGLRDAFGKTGDPAKTADVLRECQRDNAWPDWVAYFRAGERLGWDIGRSIAQVGEAIATTQWEQTLGEVLQEVSCRNRNVFVQQKPLRAHTIDSGLELVSP